MSYKGHGLKVFLFIILLGPALGSLVVVVPTILYGLYSLSDYQNNGLFGLAILLLMFSYVLGGLLAVISGIVFGILVARYGEISYRMSAIVGLLPALLILLPWRIAAHNSWQEFLNTEMSLFVLIVPASLCSALLSRWLLQRIGFIPADLSHVK